MRVITSQISALWNLSELKPADTSSTPLPLDPNNLQESMFTHSWRPWEHVYALGKASGKGGTTINQPQYNSYGKYIVKLFFLVRRWSYLCVALCTLLEADFKQYSLANSFTFITQSIHASLVCAVVVLLLGTLYQQLFKTYLHHHPVSAAISKLNFLLQGVWR